MREEHSGWTAWNASSRPRPTHLEVQPTILAPKIKYTGSMNSPAIPSRWGLNMAIWTGLRRYFLLNGLAAVALTTTIASIGVWTATELSTAIERSQVASLSLR